MDLRTLAGAPAGALAGTPVEGSPMTVRMPETAEGQPHDAPTRVVSAAAAEALRKASDRPPTDFSRTVAQDMSSIVMGRGAAESAGPPTTDSLARAAQAGFDRSALGPISKIPLPSAARGGAVGANGTIAGVVRATRMPSTNPSSPSSPVRKPLASEIADLPAPSDGETLMVSPESAAGLPPVRPELSSQPDTKSVFSPIELPPAPRAAPPSGEPRKFDGTLASEQPVLPSALAPSTSPPIPMSIDDPAPPSREESTMMVLPEEIVEDDPTVTNPPPARSPISAPSDGGTVMMAPVPAKPSPALGPVPAPTKISPIIKTSVGIAPPIFAHGPMIPPTPIVSIVPAPPPQYGPSLTPAMPSAGGLPLEYPRPRGTQVIASTSSMNEHRAPVPPKPLPQTPAMPPTSPRASYAQIGPPPVPQPPQGSLGPTSDPSRPLTYQVFNPADVANVRPRSPSLPSRASIHDAAPGMSAGMKVGIAVLGVVLIGITGAAIFLSRDDRPAARPEPPASSAAALPSAAPSFVPVPVTADPPPPDPPPAVDTASVATADPAPSAVPTVTSTGKRRKKDAVPPNPFASGAMPGKRK